MGGSGGAALDRGVAEVQRLLVVPVLLALALIQVVLMSVLEERSQALDRSSWVLHRPAIQ